MLEKLKEIKDKEALIVEIALTAKRAKGTVKNHWLGGDSIPKEYQSLVSDLIDRRLEMQKIVKRVEKDYFKNHPIKLVKTNLNKQKIN